MFKNGTVRDFPLSFTQHYLPVAILAAVPTQHHAFAVTSSTPSEC